MATSYRIREAAELLGVSDDTVRRWIDAGRLRVGVDAGGRQTVDGAALAALAEQVGGESAVPGAVIAESARNRFAGLVTRVVRDGVMAQVEIQSGRHRVTSLISRESADALGLEPGVRAVAAIKSTNVVVELPPLIARSSDPLVSRLPARHVVGTGVSPLLVAPAVLGAAFLVLPSAALVLRAPWADLPDVLRTSEVRSALVLSLVTASSATALALVLGVPLAWVLARARFRGLAIVRALILLPLVLPPVAGGVALLEALGRRGLVGQWLDQWFGITLPFTPAGVVVAETFVAMPFLVVSAEGAFRTVDVRLEEAARTLGASRGLIFRRVTVPAVTPALVAGLVLCWARALGEFGATVTFAGSYPGRTTTMPIQVSIALQTSLPQAEVLALVMMTISIAVLALLRDRWLRIPAAVR